MSKGHFFGELSLMQDIPASASIVANTILDVHALNRPDFSKIVLDHPELLVEMHRVGASFPILAPRRQSPQRPAAPPPARSSSSRTPRATWQPHALCLHHLSRARPPAPSLHSRAEGVRAEPRRLD